MNKKLFWLSLAIFGISLFFVLMGGSVWNNQPSIGIGTFLAIVGVVLLSKSVREVLLKKFKRNQS